MDAKQKAKLRSTYSMQMEGTFLHDHTDEAIMAYELGSAYAELDHARAAMNECLRRVDGAVGAVNRLNGKKRDHLARLLKEDPAAQVKLMRDFEDHAEAIRRNMNALPDAPEPPAAPNILPTSAKSVEQIVSTVRPELHPNREAEAQVYTGPFTTWHRKDAPEVEVDLATIEGLGTSYSADVIANHKESHTRRPFEVNGVEYVATGGSVGGASGRRAWEGYELIPLDDYPLPKYTYSEWNGEKWTNGYEGMIVTKGGTKEKVVLSRRVEFWYQQPAPEEATLPLLQPQVMDTLTQKLSADPPPPPQTHPPSAQPEGAYAAQGRDPDVYTLPGSHAPGWWAHTCPECGQRSAVVNPNPRCYFCGRPATREDFVAGSISDAAYMGDDDDDDGMDAEAEAAIYADETQF